MALTIVTTRAPQNAAPKPRTANPRPNQRDTSLVSSSISPLITSRNNPSVRMMIGNVTNFVTGLTTALTMLKTSATPSSVSQSPVNTTPETTCVATQSAAALTSKR